ncbi:MULTISPECIES: cell wall-active antibiotics response protein LiaF [Bacillus]|uniref:cell wall-active antibiotics response protein LiaF n=1 Tax=Bacillus TaxID=1386 RepID=UPI000BB6AA1A|nr:MULTISPECIES: cell wall-active antibiotics response protein LiaF [Bacillus]
MKSFNQKLIAILLMFFGVMLLLVNLGVISLEIKQFFVNFYPVLILLLGIKFLIDVLVKKSDNYFFGVFLLLFGGLLCLDRLALIDFKFMMIWKLWPFLIIYIGINLLLKRRPFKVTIVKDDYTNETKIVKELKSEEKGKKTNKEKQVFAVGEVKMNKQNWSVEPMKLWNIIGDYYFDFSKAYIPDKETTIQIKGMVADIKMLIPEDLPIKIDATLKTGALSMFGESATGMNSRMFYESPNYPEATRKVNIVLELKVGDVRIDRV